MEKDIEQPFRESEPHKPLRRPPPMPGRRGSSTDLSQVSRTTLTRAQPAYPPEAVVREKAAEAVGTLPDLIIIGAMKCGTTSLHEYLNYHPSVSMSKLKETNFFVQHQNWTKGLTWYKSNFSEPRKVIGESSPNYTRFPIFPGVPERMHMIVPNAKLIYCVRDPIKRMVSHYVHSYSLGRENRPFEEAMLDPDNNPYLLCSLYYYQLAQYLKYYPASQIKVVVLEEMERSRMETLRSVFEFLGVDPSYEDSRFTEVPKTMPPAKQRRRSPLKNWMVKRKMKGVYWLERNLPWVFGPPLKQPVMGDALRQELTERLRDDVNALRAFTGFRLEHWQI